MWLSILAGNDPFHDAASPVHSDSYDLPVQAPLYIGAYLPTRAHACALPRLQLEIKSILESMYGMKVERVSTINYLGRKHMTIGAQKAPRR